MPAFTLALGFALAAAGAAQTLSPQSIADTLRAAGYAEVREIEFEDGLWEAEVRRGNGYWGDVVVDPESGEIFDSLSTRPLLSPEQAISKLEGAGYRDIHELERDGALWEADAVDASGQRVELRISGHDGRILHVQPDHD